MPEVQWLAQFGLGAVMAGMMFIFYQRDRKASEDRYAALATEFRTIVQDNTKALVTLTDAMREAGSGPRR